VTIDIRPWRRLLKVWLPAVVICVIAGGVYIWQTSESGGRRAQVRERIAELEQSIARLEALERAAGNDRARIAELEQQFATLHDDVFGKLEARLTDILRAVGSATRNAGLRPGSYSYSASDERETGLVRFGIKFSVEGRYEQIRQMLAELQSSPQFLIVEGLSLSGDEAPVSQDLTISVSLATFLVEADPEQLKRLTGRLGGGGEG
jgi:Tfp pilus assembly protein PilO